MPSVGESGDRGERPDIDGTLAGRLRRRGDGGESEDRGDCPSSATLETFDFTRTTPFTTLPTADPTAELFSSVERPDLDGDGGTDKPRESDCEGDLPWRDEALSLRGRTPTDKSEGVAVNARWRSSGWGDADRAPFARAVRRALTCGTPGEGAS